MDKQGIALRAILYHVFGWSYIESDKVCRIIKKINNGYGFHGYYKKIDREKKEMHLFIKYLFERLIDQQVEKLTFTKEKKDELKSYLKKKIIIDGHYSKIDEHEPETIISDLDIKYCTKKDFWILDDLINT